MNVLEFHRFNEYLATILAILANILVIGLTVTEQNSTIRAYRRIIIATSLNDFVFCFLSLVTVMYCQISNGAVVFVVGSVFRDTGLNTHYALFFLYIFKIGIGINIISAEYYYRYLTICKKEYLSCFQVFLLVIAGWIYSAINASAFLIAFMQDYSTSKEKYGHLLKDPMWLEPNGQRPLFIGTEYTNLIIPFLIAAIGANGAYALAINWGLKIYRELNSVKHLLTKKTIRLQHAVTVMLAVQAVFPFLSSTLPVCMFIIAVLFKLNIPNLGTMIAIIAVWLPVVSPLCTIFLLGIYRRRILQFFNFGSSTSRVRSLQVTTVTDYTKVLPRSKKS